jgi:NADH-quinone oxidoreductase subunit C
VFRVLVDRGEITYFVVREHLLTLVQALRDDDALRFELCSSVSGVDYQDSGGPAPDPGRPRLHVVYHLTSMTYRRRIRLEVAVTAEDPHVPSVTRVYPTADWHERETWDMFGVVFDGHPALTRILMPDDWDGHPQRKDYPLGGVPVEYKGAQIPPPDERRSYR